MSGIVAFGTTAASRAAVSILAASALFAFQTADRTAPADPVIRVSVGLVQVDAVVTDSAGKHVTNLRADDFEILEDGKRQRITHFSTVSGAPDPGAAGKEAVLAPSRTLKRDQVTRTIVLLADDLGLSAETLPSVKAALANFVDRQMRPGDVASVLTSSGGMGALQQFTVDKRQLHAAIERIHWSPGRTGLSPFAPIEDGDPAMSRKLTRLRAQFAAANAFRSDLSGAGSIDALSYAIRGLQELPGRKALVVVSEGFPPTDRIRPLIDEANRAGVVLYAIDARGMAVTGFTAADDVHAPSIMRGDAIRGRNYSTSEEGLDTIARETGGLFFRNNNDLRAALGSALDDMSGYYLIGYQPQRGDFDAPDGAPRFHSIEVKVKRAGLHVRSRSGFFGMPELDLPVMPDSRTEQLRKALYSPFQGAIEVRLNASYSATGRDEKTGRRGAVLKGSLLIDARNLRFQDRPDGKKQVTLDVVGAAFGADGKMVANDDKTFTAVLTPEEWRETLATGFLYRMGTPIAKPGGYQFRVALRDAASGQTGSASAFVEIPDFNQPRLALSSLDLGEKNQVTRMFRPGATVRFDCDVYGARRDDTGKPRVEFEVRLFHGAERIFSGRPVPVAGQEVTGEANMQVAASGDMRLPEGLPAGDYAMELVIYDRLATGKNEAASQWSDFSIVR